MPGQPKFKCEKVQIGRESYDFHFCKLIPSLCALFGDPRFSKQLIFAQEHHYQDADHTMQVFSEMSTGKWWWSVQVHMNCNVYAFSDTHFIFSNPWSHANQGQLYCQSSSHWTRLNSHFFNLRALTQSTWPSATFSRPFIANQLNKCNCWWVTFWPHSSRISKTWQHGVRC